MRLKLLLLLILSGFILKSIKCSAQVSVQDSLALVDLYDSTGGSNWTHNNNWLTGPVSTWYGIAVSEGRVTQISFNVGENNITGNLPYSLGNLSNLSILYLEHNQLSGGIPVSLGNLTKLTGLYLAYNQVSGSIPSSLGNLLNVTELFLNNNQLRDSIPSSLGNLSKLHYLYLNNNQLSGSIPSSFGNFSYNLLALGLNNNHLSGAIPSSINKTSLPQDTLIALNNNGFTFDGLENVVKSFTYTDLYYSPQASIPISTHGDTLSVSAGGTLSNDTYKWYNGNTLVATKTGDSTFVPTAAGNYSVAVTNAIATQLTLYSDTVKPNSIIVQECFGFDYNDTVTSNLTGTSYQWQEYNGSSFVNMQGQIYPQLITTTSYGEQVRCIVDGDTSVVFTVQLVDTWEGTVSSAWEDFHNWSCWEVPNASTDVYINSGTPPVILSSNTTVRSITVNPSASFSIVSPYTLTVTH